jgi:hypothetical protein
LKQQQQGDWLIGYLNDGRTHAAPFETPLAGDVVACLSLFLALSGVTYAATGGNFLLGKPNSATSPSASRTRSGW